MMDKSCSSNNTEIHHINSVTRRSDLVVPEKQKCCTKSSASSSISSCWYRL